MDYYRHKISPLISVYAFKQKINIVLKISMKTANWLHPFSEECCCVDNEIWSNAMKWKKEESTSHIPSQENNESPLYSCRITSYFQFQFLRMPTNCCNSSVKSLLIIEIVIFEVFVIFSTFLAFEFSHKPRILVAHFISKFRDFPTKDNSL